MSGWRSRLGLDRLLGSKRPEEVIEEWGEEVERPAPIKTRATPGLMDGLWTREVPVEGRRILPPDPRMMKAIGLNHSFQSAVADIVDNSIDAGARNILVRIVREADRLVGLCIVDDGRGMDAATIDRAMTVGGERTYDGTDLGHFGIGLKAASLGQARILTVASRANGSGAVGRRWLIENASTGFECDVLAGDFASSLLDRDWQHLKPVHGTVVMWTEVRSFAAIGDARAIDKFVDNYLMTLRHHLGLVFHRLLSSKKVQMAVDVEDVSAGEIGLTYPVEPIDPFGYVKSGKGEYPRTLKSSWHGQSVEFRCHIWPGRSHHPNFRLLGGRPEDYQGFYIYRNDRLLQQGGWNGVFLCEREQQLARVAIDITGSQSALLSMNAEKTRVEASPQFGALVQAATDDKVSFSAYIDHAKDAYRESQRRRRERPKVVQPGKGFAVPVRAAIDQEYDFLPGDALSIRWVELDDDTFFEIDREENLVRLNRRYRSAIIGGRTGSVNDAPLVKALIYLLAESSFRGSFLGARSRDNLAIWQSILTAAARAETK